LSPSRGIKSAAAATVVVGQGHCGKKAYNFWPRLKGWCMYMSLARVSWPAPDRNFFFFFLYFFCALFCAMVCVCSAKISHGEIAELKKDGKDYSLYTWSRDPGHVLPIKKKLINKWKLIK
jgi:hypothetical protein